MSTCSVLRAFLLLTLITASNAQLVYDFYAASCPNLAAIVRATVTAHALHNPTTPAALLRLLFHDCQVQGCDGSVLLDSHNGIISERESVANAGLRRLEVIDDIKASVERICPNTVSCADLLVLAARDAVKLTGGPFIEVPLGRRDSMSASKASADAALPFADSGFDGFLRVFKGKGMTMEESVAMLGAHTLGVGHCASVENRLYPERDANLGPVLYSVLRLACPARETTSAGGGVQLPNDLTALKFDTQYFDNALEGRGLFRVDAEVARNPLTAPIVQSFNANPAAFFHAFSSAFVKLSLSNVLTAPSQGNIRQNCRIAN
ncbi:hypothetical protein L7F22_032423 [Adiantum nelumboides]|nr:hypothetical protein [Adiantum nelumboides]